MRLKAMTRPALAAVMVLPETVRPGPRVTCLSDLVVLLKYTRLSAPASAAETFPSVTERTSAALESMVGSLEAEGVGVAIMV